MEPKNKAGTAFYVEKKNKVVRIYSQNYQAFYRRVSEHSIFMQRKIHYTKAQKDIDVTGNYSLFAMANIKPKTLYYVKNRKLIEISGPTAIFTPPFSIVEWFFTASQFSYKSLVMDIDLPRKAPTESVIFPYDNSMYFPLSEKDVLDILRDQTDCLSMTKEDKTTAIAQKTKKFIDATYTENMKLSEIAEKLNLSLTVMSRFFGQNYGMTPVEYRARLRTADAIRILLFHSESVADTAFSVGFRDTSRFYRQLKKHQKALPSDFQF